MHLLECVFKAEALIKLIHRIMMAWALSHNFFYEEVMQEFVDKTVYMRNNHTNENNFSAKGVKGLIAANWTKRITMLYNQVCRSQEYQEF